MKKIEISKVDSTNFVYILVKYEDQTQKRKLNNFLNRKNNYKNIKKNLDHRHCKLNFNQIRFGLLGRAYYTKEGPILNIHYISKDGSF